MPRRMPERYSSPAPARPPWMPPALTQNVFTKDDRLLVVAGGSFGHRFCEICEVYGIPHTAIELRQGHALTPADLAPYAGQGYTGFLVNMHETSTGVLYDMDMISAFCRENGLVLVVDAISAFLADDVSMKRWGADVAFTGSQKALAVPPGISMMVLSSRAVERIYANRPACYYLDLKAALKSARTVLHIGRKGLFSGTVADYLASPQGRRFREELES